MDGIEDLSIHPGEIPNKVKAGLLEDKKLYTERGATAWLCRHGWLPQKYSESNWLDPGQLTPDGVLAKSLLQKARDKGLIVDRVYFSDPVRLKNPGKWSALYRMMIDGEEWFTNGYGGWRCPPPPYLEAKEDEKVTAAFAHFIKTKYNFPKPPMNLVGLQITGRANHREYYFFDQINYAVDALFLQFTLRKFKQVDFNSSGQPDGPIGAFSKGRLSALIMTARIDKPSHFGPTIWAPERKEGK